jgi:hypothetical protein
VPINGTKPGRTLVEHERRSGCEQKQVVPFDRRANDARDGNSRHAVLDFIRFEGTVNGGGVIHGILHGKLSASDGYPIAVVRAGHCSGQGRSGKYEFFPVRDATVDFTES